MEMILRMRIKQPAEYEQLQPDTKLLALEYESQKRDAEVLRNAREASKETRADGDTAPRAA
jgi:hypothetical protein